MTSRELANDRLRQDIWEALTAGAADASRSPDPAESGHRLQRLLNARSEQINAVVRVLKRNWRVSERARGERSV